MYVNIDLPKQSIPRNSLKWIYNICGSENYFLKHTYNMLENMYFVAGIIAEGELKL